MGSTDLGAQGAVPLQLWAGIECTVNRVVDRFHDQLVMGGHHERLDDLDRLAGLGVRRLRYPVLWERTAPDGVEQADWSWSDERMERMRQLGIAPIVGLLHHGSGPRETCLLDPDFPRKLARYARAVAERYPDVDLWTPINEIVTTARFAGLYGFWYPHARDIRSFVRALMHQCQGVALAMRAIRAVNPAAQLVQPEDLGRVRSTPRLAYQARYENERQVLALELLCGRVSPAHPLWDHLRACGASEAELYAFVEQPVVPDIIGVNYYITSDRYLDHRLERYPAALHGGNGRDHYADVEAVRVPLGIAGHGSVLRETWERYGRPLAITEVHVGCTVDEQLRWLAEAWQAAKSAINAGADVRAVTVWAAFGTVHWDKLVTSLDGQYEPGLFDSRVSPPRPTALARATSALTTRGRLPEAVLRGRPWWRRPERVLYPEQPSELTSAPTAVRSAS